MNSSSQTILITGATGFLGRYLVKRFHREGARVIAASRTATSKNYSFPDGVRLVDIDITDPDTLGSAVNEADIIVHSAAKVGDWGKPQEFMESIRDGTGHLLRILNKQKIKQFIHISSVAVYGIEHPDVITEEITTAGAQSWPYSMAKVAAEQIVMDYYKNRNIPVTIIRPANIYGPGSHHWTDRPAQLIEKGLLNLPKGFGKSNTVFVENVVEGIVSACNNSAAIGEAFNIRDDFLVDWDEFFLNYALVYGKKKISVLPVGVMKSIAGTMEGMSMITGKPPLVTRLAIDFLRFQGIYSIEKIRDVLDFHPPFDQEKAFGITRQYLKDRALS